MEGGSNPKEVVVMLCVDDGEFSMNAFEWYYAHFHRIEHTVLLAHIYTAPELLPVSGHHRLALDEIAKDDYQKHADEVHRKSAAVVKKYAELCRGKGMNCRTVAKEKCSDGVGHTLCSIASDNHASCIVIGQRGLGLIKRTIFGTVSDYVLHHAKRSVLVVSPNMMNK